MSIRIETESNTNSVMAIGRIDALTATEFEDTILPLISENNPSIKINCKKVTYISSAGLRAFILADKKSNNFGGRITITSLKDDLKNIFDIAGLTELFHFV